MNTNRLSARPALGWLMFLLTFGLVGSLWASTAHAVDNTLASSQPAADGTVETSPATLELTFVQPLGPGSVVQMTCGEQGTLVPLRDPLLRADQVTLSVQLVAAAPKGTCTVAWTVRDTNLQVAGSSSFRFTIASDPAPTTAASTTTVAGNTTTVAGATTVPGASTVPVAGTTVAPVVTTAPSNGGNTADTDAGTGTKGPLALFRFGSNLGLAVLFGSLLLIAIAWPEGVEYLITVRFLRFTWLATMVSTYLFAAALAAFQSGDGFGSALVPTGWGGLTDTTPGKAALVRLVFVAASAYAVMRPERTIDPATQLPALVPPGIAVVTMAFSRSEFGAIEYAAGALHALAMAVWLGGLILLIRVVLAGPGEEDLVHAVRGFARMATPALWVTVITGAVQLFRLDRGALGTSHGLVVIVKTLFVSLMVFVGVAARQFINQRVARVDTMTMPLAVRLRKALTVEALVGVLVMLLSAWLLALTPPGLSSAGNGALDLKVLHRFQNTTLGVEVSVAFSERVGANDVRIEVVAAPATGIAGLVVDFIPPPGSSANGMTISKIPLTTTGVAVLEKSDGFTLTTSGTWTIVVRLGDTVVAEQDVLVTGGTLEVTTST